METGADEYLIKPFAVKELQLRVCNLLNLRKRLQEKITRGDFSIIKVEKKLSSSDKKFTIKLKEIVEKHLSEEEFSIEEFAKEIGMSRTQLHRKITALVGTSASQYVRSIRLNKAKENDRRKNSQHIGDSVLGWFLKPIILYPLLQGRIWTCTKRNYKNSFYFNFTISKTPQYFPDLSSAFTNM